MVRMVVESYSVPKICDQTVAQTYNPGIEVWLKKKKKKKKKQTQYRKHSFTGQLHNDGMPFMNYM